MKKQKNTGITLIALVVTVIVLLILAGISASMLSGNNGIINKAGSAKEQTEIAKEKEAIGTATLQAANKGKYGDITQENLQQQINNEFGEEKNAKVYDEEENFLVLIENRLYKVDKDGNVELSESNFEFPKKEFLAQLSNNELGTSEDKPYEIRCIEDLLDFSLTVNGITIENNEIKYITGKNFSGKYVSLVKNLDFKVPLSYENAERIDYGDINQDGKVEKLLTELTTGKGWIPIGGNGQNNTGVFSGYFDGNGNSIKSLYINDEQETVYKGLFGSTNGNLSNLIALGNVYSKSQSTGGISGYAGGKIKNCSFNGKIENTYSQAYGTGGIIGYGSAQIINCNCSGKIQGNNNYVGGIVGEYTGCEISYCYNESNVIGNKSYAGGIIGHCRDADKISNCYNTGKIESVGGAAGIIAYRYKNIENCYNTGEIIGKNNVGGIGGLGDWKQNIQISQCFNEGKVTGNSNVGGIVGSNSPTYNLTLIKCYNKGSVISINSSACGIAGDLGSSASKVINCYNYGLISGKTIAGITKGSSNKLSIISCYNVGELKGTTKFSISNNGIVENCYYISNQGTAIGNALEVTGEQLKTLAPTLDKAYTIDEETGAVTISETEIQNVWKEDTENKNEGYPIFKWQ